MKGRLTAKERVKIPRQKMPEQEPASRRQNFQEVNLGLAASVAATEASRCIECADPKCVKGCPVGVKVREFVELVAQGDYKAAAAKMREDNVLPAVTGRVCPQEDQCEGACVMGKKFDPLAIGYLERFIADWEADSGELGLPPRAPPTGKKVACVGSGPASLTVAGDLVQKGHDVTVFEALHEIGGVLVYGIPEFRLPEGHRAPRDREHGEDGRPLRDERRRRAHRHDRRAPAAGGLRRRLRRHGRRPAEVPGRPRREPERRLLGQRVPLARQPDEGLPLPRVRRAHLRLPREERGRDRRRQHRARRHPHGAAPRAPRRR